MSQPGKLDARQELFCQEYLKDLNATRAAERAGYSPNGLHKRVHRLMANEGIQARIQELMAERSKRVEIEADTIIRELAILGFSSVDHYHIDDNGNVTILDDAPEHAIRAISSIKKRVTHLGEGRIEYTTEVRLWNKVESLKHLGQHVGLFSTKKIELTGKSGKAIEVKARHEPAQRISSLRGLIEQMLADSPADRGPGADGPGQPVDSPGTNGAAKVLPGPH